MEIIELQRTEIGVLITYKNWLGIIKKREAIRVANDLYWEWADNEMSIMNSEALGKFIDSSKISYILNKG